MGTVPYRIAAISHQLVNDSQGNVYVSLEYMAELRQSVNVMMGLLAFFAGVRLVGLLRLNYRCALLADVIVESKDVLLEFG